MLSSPKSKEDLLITDHAIEKLAQVANSNLNQLMLVDEMCYREQFWNEKDLKKCRDVFIFAAYF